MASVRHRRRAHGMVTHAVLASFSIVAYPSPLR